MGEQFKKLKRKYLYAAIVKSAAIGISCALFAVGIILLPCKLAGAELNAGYYVLIAFFAAAVSGGVTFLILAPTEKKLALNLDVRYGLNERVQTALAFSTESGTIVQMQREDAEQRLTALPKEKFNLAHIWQYVVIAVVAIAMLFTAIFVPAKADSSSGAGGGVNVDPPFAFAEIDREAVLELIDNVNSSALEDDLKESAAGILNELIDELEKAEYESEKKSAVSGAMFGMDLLLRGATSYVQLSSALATANLIDLAWINADGVKVYRDFLLKDFEGVEAFYSASVQAVTDATAERFDLFKEKLDEDSSAIASDIYVALLAARAFENDELYAVLSEFSHALTEQEDWEQLYLKFTYDITDELAAQSYKLAVNRFVIDRLALIFFVDALDYADYAPGENLQGPSEDGNHSGEGGFGNGDVLYGSDDLVYDPDSGEYVEYGVLMNKLYAIVQDRLRSGLLTEEQANAVIAYFEILWSGVPAE